MELNTAKIIRVRNIHVAQLYMLNEEKHLLDYLTEHEFILTETSSDGFIETWWNEKYKDQRIHTLFFLDANGSIVHRQQLTAIT